MVFLLKNKGEDEMKNKMVNDLSYEQQHLILGNALGLENEKSFKSFGERGKNNYQFLFSKFKQMIENDQKGQLVDKPKQILVTQSLQHTIDYYDADTPSKVQHILTNLKKDDPSSFVIIPGYARLSLGNEVYGLLIHKDQERYIVTKTSRFMNRDHFGYLNKHANGCIVIPEKELAQLSQILFRCKQKLLQESGVHTARSIQWIDGSYTSGLPIEWRNDKYIKNYPVNELLATLRVTLDNIKQPFLFSSYRINTKSNGELKLMDTECLIDPFYETFKGKSNQEQSGFNMIKQTYEHQKKQEYDRTLSRERRTFSSIVTPTNQNLPSTSVNTRERFSNTQSMDR